MSLGLVFLGGVAVGVLGTWALILLSFAGEPSQERLPRPHLEGELEPQDPVAQGLWAARELLDGCRCHPAGRMDYERWQRVHRAMGLVRAELEVKRMELEGEDYGD